MGSLSWLPHYTSCNEYHNDKDKKYTQGLDLTWLDSLFWVSLSYPWAIVWTLYICTLNYLADFKVLFCFYSLIHVFLFVFWTKYMPLQENMRFASWTGFKLALPGLCLIVWSFGCLPSRLALTGMTWVLFFSLIFYLKLRFFTFLSRFMAELVFLAGPRCHLNLSSPLVGLKFLFGCHFRLFLKIWFTLFWKFGLSLLLANFNFGGRNLFFMHLYFNF